VDLHGSFQAVFEFAEKVTFSILRGSFRGSFLERCLIVSDKFKAVRGITQTILDFR
jgi:hypothetical protein